MTCVLAGFGANLGNPQATYESALRHLQRHLAIQGLRASRLYRTTPVGGPSMQPDYINGCFALDTELSPHELLATFQETETFLGRERSVRWGPRTIDLDLLLFGDRVIETPDLLIPHPRLHYRRFVLAPLTELCPHAVHPLIGTSIADLARSVDGGGRIVLASSLTTITAEAECRCAERGIRTVASIPSSTLGCCQCVGPFVVAAAVAPAARRADPRATWIVLLDEPSTRRAAEPVLPLSPVADCRGRTDAERLERMTTFLDALTGAVVPV